MIKELPPKLEQPEHHFGNGFESYAASAAHEKPKPGERSALKNEDTTLANAERGLFGVFDGMGGHAAGEVASRLAKEEVEQITTKFPKNLTLEQTKEVLATALQKAHEKIQEAAKQNTEYEGMGTTASVVKIWEQDNERKAVIGYIGDSRAYLIHKDGTLEQITEDESEFSAEKIKTAHEKMIDQNVSFESLTPEEQVAFNNRNAIQRAVGGREEFSAPRIKEVAILEGDKILITSDGIHDNLTDKEIKEIFDSALNANEAMELLLQKTRERSRDATKKPVAKDDDASAVLIEIERQVKLPELPRERKFHVGDSVKVQRSSGEIEPDWEIINIFEEGGKKVVRVRKQEGKVFSQKKIPLDELAKLNSLRS